MTVEVPGRGQGLGWVLTVPERVAVVAAYHRPVGDRSWSTRPERAVMVAAYLAGLTIEEVAEATGRSYSTVHRALTAAGVKRRPSNRFPICTSAAQRPAVVAAYEAGQHIRQIADATGVSYGTVRRVLVAAGVRLRPRGGRPRQAPAGASS